MAYPHSNPMDPASLKDLANSTSRAFCLEWNNAGIKGDIRRSSFDPNGHGFSLSIPECLPERVEVGTRLYDLGFYNDDLLDDVDDRGDALAINPSWANGYESVDRKPVAITQVKGSTAKRQLEAKTMLQAISIDREGALYIMETWKQFLQDSESKQKFDMGSKSWKDWIQFRYLDGALLATHSLACFSMGVVIPEEEKEAVRHIVEPILTNVIMINDYYSFAREYEEYIINGRKHDMKNSVWFLMQHEGLEEHQAKQRVLEEALESERNYTIARRAYEEAHPDMAPRIARYLDAAMFLATGAWYWTTFSSRYRYIYRLEKVPDHRPVDISLDAEKNAALDARQAFGPKYTCNGSSVPVQHFHTTTIGLKAGQYFTDVNKTDLSDEIVLAPYEYLSSLPSKGVRAAAIDALDIWLNVPACSLAPIRLIVEYLHSASLMLDDIEDHSPLRRGQPATHTIFAPAQTINSANYLFLLSVIELHKLPSPRCTEIYERQLKRLHIGQSLDLNWTNHVTCPTIAEYVEMVDHKTGGLFCLIGNLMQTESLDNLPKDTTIEHLMLLLGRYFQIRDDYQNLVSTDYAASKGFCEDLDEGKYSLALIHALQYPGPETLQLRAILQERSRKGAMTLEMKKLVREIMGSRGSLDYVRGMLKDMESAVEKEILRIEEVTGVTNYVIRLLFERLKVE